MASGAIAGIEKASVGALTKLQQVLPARLRHRVRAFGASTLALPAHGPRVDPDVLTLIAGACRDREVLRFEYVAHSGTKSRRRVEPHRLATDRRRWYLLAWDLDREDWRTFRVDRIQPVTPPGPRFAPRPLPPDDEIADRMARGIGEATWRYRARVIVHAGAETVRARIPIPVDVRSLGDDRCEFRPGSDDPHQLALYLGMLGVDFEVIDAPELVEALRVLAARFERAAGAGAD